MKRVAFTGLSLLAMYLIPLFCFSQGTKNFIKEWTATAPETDPNNLMTRSLRDVKLSTTYFDGLGRPQQSVVKKGSLVTSTGLSNDLVTPFEYDNMGREIKKYLPYVAAAGDGLFKDNAITSQNSFYSGSSSPVYGQGENTFYAQTDYEPSPLNRVVKQMAPGVSWAGSGRGVSLGYYSNTTTDAVRIWNVTDVTNGFGTYSSSSTYAAGELYKNITADETLKQVIEFNDKEGRMILKKVQLTAANDDGTGKGHTGWLCTYYIYDDLGQLRCVIQPNAVEAMNNTSNWTLNATTLNELVFRYEYDARGRMIMKKVPGAGAVYMVYDKRDRLTMTQDANMRTGTLKWMVTIYDNLNRPVKTGLWTDGNSLSYHLSQASATSNYYYPFNSEPSNNWELLTETHYDNYTNLPAGLYSTLYNSGYGTYLTASSGSPDYAEPLVQSASVKGMITWTRVKVLGTASQFISAATIYDEKGRAIQIQRINVTGGLDVVTNQYSFSGQVLRSHIKHQKAGTNPQNYNLAAKNSYDDLGRITLIEKNINNGGWKQLSSLSYDAMGQLKNKKIAPSYSSGAGLETLTYDYNIRGWLLGANRDFAKDGNNNNWFGFDLGYDKANNNIIGNQTYSNPQYNGNIEGMVWKSKEDGEKRKYDFYYDAANRLLRGDFTQYTGGTFNQNAGVNFNIKMGDGSNVNTAYDANGNILKMQQWGLKIAGVPR